MGAEGRPKAELILTDDERAVLVRRAKSAQALTLRARIVLACADGADNLQVAGLLRVSPATAGKRRRRFVQLRLDGPADEERPARPATITDEQVEAVIVATLEEVPENATHWSRASMAERSGLSRSTAGRIRKAFKLKPHLAEGFKASADPATNFRRRTLLVPRTAFRMGWGGTRAGRNWLADDGTLIAARRNGRPCWCGGPGVRTDGRRWPWRADIGVRRFARGTAVT